MAASHSDPFTAGIIDGTKARRRGAVDDGQTFLPKPPATVKLEVDKLEAARAVYTRLRLEILGGNVTPVTTARFEGARAVILALGEHPGDWDSE